MRSSKGILHLLLLTALNFTCDLTVTAQINLEEQEWIHGSKDCSENTDAPIQVVQYDRNTWILRQNKCLNYEAPFMFLFLGENKALLMDTGATKLHDTFPLYETVANIIDIWEEQQNKKIELIVAHTHKHGDHYAADRQFNAKPNTTVVGLEKTEVLDFFKFKNWPNNNVNFELGNRSINLIPIPGHQESSIAVYDASSNLLLTGDTFYPGRLYIDDWSSFKESINRLVLFSNNHQVKHILGNHIEMSINDGIDYPIGSTYHPEEQKLQLSVSDLKTLQIALNKLGDKPIRKVFKKYIVYPNN